ncbi:MAG: hypothetical protein E6J89_19890 [Deltaproteobacteria bacterium]|nr:MAG: hypothetical protein E6J89_19890 [Deltaproteobacteria bacterium]
MANQKSGSGDGPTIRELYPGLSDEQLKEAKENLERYLELALRIYDRIRSDPEAYSQFRALTASGRTATIDVERSNPS